MVPWTRVSTTRMYTYRRVRDVCAHTHTRDLLVSVWLCAHYAPSRTTDVDFDSSLRLDVSSSNGSGGGGGDDNDDDDDSHN